VSGVGGLAPRGRRQAGAHPVSSPPRPPALPHPRPPPGIPFYIGANNALNFWLGSLINHFWKRVGPATFEEFSSVVGSGLLVGSGIFAIPSAVLSLAGVLPPMCMSFSSAPPKSPS
jgi:hypothetical protein